MPHTSRHDGCDELFVPMDWVRKSRARFSKVTDRDNKDARDYKDKELVSTSLLSLASLLSLSVTSVKPLAPSLGLVL